jgi:hypothetical protein
MVSKDTAFKLWISDIVKLCVSMHGYMHIYVGTCGTSVCT